MTVREDRFDKAVAPAADRILGTIPDRRDAAGRPVQVAMENTTYSKGDGAYTNALIKDGHRQDARIMEAVNRVEVALGLTATKADVSVLGGKLDALEGLLADSDGGQDIDAAAVAAQVLELLPDSLAADVVTAMGRQLAGPAADGQVAP